MFSVLNGAPRPASKVAGTAMTPGESVDRAQAGVERTGVGHRLRLAHPHAHVPGEKRPESGIPFHPSRQQCRAAASRSGRASISVAEPFQSEPAGSTRLT